MTTNLIQTPEAAGAETTQEGGQPRREFKDFVAARVVAERIGKCELTVRTWAQQGIIPSVRIGRSVLFHWPSVVEALLRMQRNGHQ